jgi:antitoxin (DNA-binding transcriptional repressor) of toxin-antitoxin stability system
VTVPAEECRVSFGYWIDRVAAGEDVIVTRRGQPMIRLSAFVQAPAPPSEAPAPLLMPQDAEAGSA